MVPRLYQIARSETVHGAAFDFIRFDRCENLSERDRSLEVAQGPGAVAGTVGYA